MCELEHSGIAHVVILHLNLKSFGTRFDRYPIKFITFKYYYFLSLRIRVFPEK